MKRSSRRVGKWLTLGMLLMMPIALGWIVVTHPIPPGGTLTRSYALPATKGLAHYSGCDQGYTWVDARTVRQIDAVNGKSIIIHDTDVANGKTRTIASFPKGKEIGFLAPQLTHISPDRQWVLYTGSIATTLMRVQKPLSSLQLPLAKPYPNNQPIFLVHRSAWMRDNLHWIEMTEDKQGKGVLLVHTVGSPTVRSLSLPNLAPLTGTTPWRSLIGITARNTALIEGANWKGGQRVPLQFWEVDLTTGQISQSAALNQQVSLIAADHDSPILSPQGDRIVWTTPWYPNLLTVLAGQFQHRSVTVRSELFTCRLDGSEFRMIDSADHNGRDQIRMLDWLPDGKHISFDYRNTLYTAPID